MAKKIVVIDQPEMDCTVIKESTQESPVEIEKKAVRKVLEPVKIKSKFGTPFRGPYYVVDEGVNIFEFGTKRGAYDKALEINASRGFSTFSVREILD